MNLAINAFQRASSYREEFVNLPEDPPEGEKSAHSLRSQQWIRYLHYPPTTPYEFACRRYNSLTYMYTIEHSPVPAYSRTSPVRA